MNKIQISLLILSLWVISCSSGPKETKESPAVEESTTALPKVAQLPVTFTAVDSLSLFPDATLELNTPLSNQVFKPGKVPFEFNIKNFSLKTKGIAAPRLLMILNGGDSEGFAAPIFHRELAQGTYRIVAFLVDQKGLSLKSFGNYLDRDFLVGDSRPFPYSAEPYLAINLPRNEQIIPFGQDLILDFLVLGGDLKLDGLKVKIWINAYQTETNLIVPLRISNLPVGDYQVKVQLLRTTNKELEGSFSSRTKTIYVR